MVSGLPAGKYSTILWVPSFGNSDIRPRGSFWHLWVRALGGMHFQMSRVQFQGKWQQIQYDFYFTVHWFSLWIGKVSSEIRKDKRQGRRKNEARILCKVILDTFSGWFSAVFSWLRWIRKRQCVSWQRQTERTSTPEGAGASTRAVPFPGKWQQIQYDFYFTVHWFSLWIEKVSSSEIRKRQRLQIRGKFPYKGI